MSSALTAWPEFAQPGDVEKIEEVPLADRGLPASTVGILRRAARLWPDRIAISVMPDAERWREVENRTFASLYADSCRIANLLRDLGVSRTTPVGILSPNCAGLVPAMFGAQAAGVAVPLNGGLSSEHLATLVARTGVEVLIAAGPDLDLASWEKTVRLCMEARIGTLLVLSPTAATTKSQLPALERTRVAYLDEEASGQAEIFDDEPAADDLAAIFHTGGTTGTPKLAAHTHRNQVADAWMIAADSTAGENTVGFAALPLFHVNALHVTILAPLLKGTRVVWAGPLGYRDPALYGVIWQIVEHFKIVSMSGVPTVYAVMAQCPIDADISSLRFAVVGASALPQAVRQAFEDHTGVPLLEGYGLTEATCASARSFLSQPRPGSVGKRMPYQPMRVVSISEDGSWTDVADGAVGSLLIGGPTVFPGYVTRRTADGFELDGLGILRDGWLDTGDLARLDDGFVYLIGRSKDLIIRGGHNIEPASIEAALMAHPDVSDAAAVGRPDPRAGELPVAYVTVAPGSSVTAADIENWLASTDLEGAARPKVVTILDQLPVTDVGKPYKPTLRADAAQRAIAEALAALEGVDAVEGRVVDGSVQVDVFLARAARDEVDAVLAQFPVATHVVEASPGES